MTRVLQLVPLPVPASYRLPADLIVERGFENPSLDAWLAQNGADVSAVITHSLHGMPADLWPRLPSLKLIANFGVGLDRIDLRVASNQQVWVTYTPDLLTNDVADLGMAFLLGLSRRLLAADAYVRRGAWGKEPFGPGRSIAGRRIGIFGMGRIGKAIARRASAFGMEIGYYSRSSADGAFTRLPSLVELATWADVLVAAVPGGDETRHVIDARILNALGANGLFINISRGSVVDAAALTAALRSSAIAGAGLDVFEDQPIDGTSFADLSNVILTPHIGSQTIDTRVAMADSVYGNVRALLSGEILRDVAIS